ncbi:OmpH family outer membrane protein [Candidatus Latescibacterota bacterium]
MLQSRIILIMVIIAISAMIIAPVDVSAELKLAFVRTSYVLSKHQPYLDAVKEYEGFEKSEVEKLQKMGAAFQQKVADSQKQAAFMTEDKIRELSMQLEQENRQLEQQSEQLYNRDGGVLAKKYGELLKPVFDKVNSVIFQFRKDEGYAFIFEAESEALLDADEQYDISDKVIEKLNAAE